MGNKLVFEYNNKATAIVEQMAADRCETPSRTLMFALALYSYLSDEVRAGGKIAIERDGKVAKHIILP